MGAQVDNVRSYSMRRLIGSAALVAVMSVAVAGCEPETVNDGSPHSDANRAGHRELLGSVGVNGAQTFAFQALSSGFVQATIKTFGPETEMKVGFSIGTYNGITCQQILVNDEARQGITITGSVATAAALCVRLYDVGQLTQANTFEITVIHP
jgi:hypothetical protein